MMGDDFSTPLEADAEELLYRDRLLTVISPTTTTTTNFIIFEGIDSAMSMYVGELNITWESASINISSSVNRSGFTNFTYFLLASENASQLVPENESSLLENRSGVVVLPMGGTAFSAQLSHVFEPNSTQFLLLLASVHDAVSSNRKATRITISSVDPVLIAGVNVVEVTATADLEA